MRLGDIVAWVYRLVIVPVGAIAGYLRKSAHVGLGGLPMVYHT